MCDSFCRAHTYRQVAIKEKIPQCLIKVLGHQKSFNAQKSTDSISLWNCTRGMNTILSQHNPSVGVLMMEVKSVPYVFNCVTI